MIKEYHQRDHLSRKGRLLYTSRKPDRMGEERGPGSVDPDAAFRWPPVVDVPR